MRLLLPFDSWTSFPIVLISKCSPTRTLSPITPTITPIKHAFIPYPDYRPTPSLAYSPPSISVRAAENHFQQLLLYSLSPLPLTGNLLHLPAVPTHNTNPNGLAIIIKAPHKHKCYPWCHSSDSPPSFTPRTFSDTTCRSLCKNQYSAFRSIPHLRLPPNYASSTLLAQAPR